MHSNVGKLRTRVAEDLAKSGWWSWSGLQRLKEVFSWCCVSLLLTVQKD